MKKTVKKQSISFFHVTLRIDNGIEQELDMPSIASVRNLIRKMVPEMRTGEYHTFSLSINKSSTRDSFMRDSWAVLPGASRRFKCPRKVLKKSK